jgi:glycosyltransferase involved in cell wall biosynthesis/SAM-dependent methyltransferase
MTTDPTSDQRPTVSVVMIFLNASRFIEEALASVQAQTFRDWELILVDDGSSDRSTDVARAYAAREPARISYVDHEGHANLGMSASRNAGINRARGHLIAFIDSDDVWEPSKLSEQVALLEGEPASSAVIGTPLYWHGWTGIPADAERDHVPGLGFPGNQVFAPPDLLFKSAPFGAGPVPCPSDILVRRDVITRLGGFEPRFRGAYEDTAFLVKLYLYEPVLAAERCWTRYRCHPDSCMAVTVREQRYDAVRLLFLNWLEEFMTKRGLRGTEAWSRLQDEVERYRRPLAALASPDGKGSDLLRAAPNPVPTAVGATTIAWTTPDGAVGQVWVSQNGGHESLFAEGASGSQAADWISPGARYDFRLYGDTTRSALLETVSVTRLVDVGVGGESFGSLRRVVPLSRSFGFERGQPIDRYYIERFLGDHAHDVRGRVLEVGDSAYTRRFGGTEVSAIDVLHINDGNPEATIVDDLSRATRLPSAAFDCVLVIQTLHLIFDLAEAVRTIRRILKPGGVVLATFPGISPSATMPGATRGTGVSPDSLRIASSMRSLAQRTSRCRRAATSLWPRRSSMGSPRRSFRTKSCRSLTTAIRRSLRYAR